MRACPRYNDPTVMRVFCILNGAMEVASARERILRYAKDLETAGISLETHIAGEVAPGLPGRFRYWLELIRSIATADGILIHRVPLSASERALLRASGRPVIFDVDDAVWYRMDPAPDGTGQRSHRYNDLIATLRLCKMVRAGNSELASFVEALGLRVRKAPTCVPVNPPPEMAAGSRPLTIGWIGHSANYRYLGVCAEALRRLRLQRPDIRFVFSADRPPEGIGIPVDFTPWSLESEEEVLRSMDIGIMPLADDPWTRGKCGYKILRYMAVGLPVVASPVGVNTKLVEHGLRGFLARTSEEWLAALVQLADHPRMRRDMGQAGINFVRGEYDTDTGLRQLISDLNEAFRPRGHRERRRVTMLLFHHPTLGGSASCRNARMALHLLERGWEPAVVTVSRLPYYFSDKTIPHVPPAVRVPALDTGILAALPLKLGMRRPHGMMMNWIAFPDRWLLWALRALPVSLPLARGSAAIYSTSPPESSHLLAYVLKKLTGRPWVADHSNEWSQNPAKEDPALFRRLNGRLERFVLDSADRITTLSPAHTRLLQSIYPRPHRISTLWTGWDPAEANPPCLPPPRDRAVILFAGMFYGIQRPDPFLDAAERSGLKGVELHVLGDPWDSSERLRQAAIPVKFLGRVPRSEALKMMRNADFLLITLTERAGGVVPGKMFEYAAAGRPILAVVPPEGEVARWVLETKTGFVVPCSPAEEASSRLREIIDQWRRGELRFDPDMESLSRYSMPAMAAELNRLLRDATAS